MARTMSKQSTWIMVFMFVIISAVNCGAQPSTEETRSLRDFFSVTSRSAESRRSAEKQIPKLCLDIGEPSIPILADVLRDTLQARSPSGAAVGSLAVKCLIYVGGPEVVRLFRKMYAESRDPSDKKAMRAVLCDAMQSTGSDQDIQFLIDSLEGPLGGLDGLAPTSATFALAVLKPQAAKAALKKRAEEYKPIVLEDVQYALERINGLEWGTPQAGLASPRDQVILTLFRFGIPHITLTHTFAELKTNRLWKRTGRTWSYDESPVTKDESLPAISFDVSITKDGERAMCSVGIYCGPTCGYGYDFILRRDKHGWWVVGLFPTWLS